MKATELMIGNFVEWNGLIFQVESISDNRLKLTRNTEKCLFEKLANISEIKPIILTDEWLIKFGFEKIYDGEYDRFNIFKTFKYVHDLQNLINLIL